MEVKNTRRKKKKQSMLCQPNKIQKREKRKYWERIINRKHEIEWQEDQTFYCYSTPVTYTWISLLGTHTHTHSSTQSYTQIQL